MTTPKKVFQVSKKGIIDPVLVPVANTWKKSNYSYILYDDREIMDFIKKEFPEFYTPILNFSKHIERIDTWRYLYLYRYGGIYADTDCELLNNFPEYIFHSGKVTLAYEGREIPLHSSFCLPEGTLGNALIISPPKSKFLYKLVKEIIKEYSLSNSVIENTGPHKLTKFYRKYPNKEEIEILPTCSIYPRYLSISPKKFDYEHRLMNNISSVCGNNIKDTSFVIHYWFGSWWGDKIDNNNNHYMYDKKRKRNNRMVENPYGNSLPPVIIDNLELFNILFIVSTLFVIFFILQVIK